ncbi:MAG: chemotaxis protein CheC [Cycloclasticus sp.]|jgi:Chemotaxis protein CheC, inhibitor of MCP methylation
MMNNPNAILDDIHLDALGELLNIGMGAATASLSTMVRQEVLLSVPVIRVLAQQKVPNQLYDKPPHTISGVRQSFSGEFCGDALLLFTDENSISLVRAVLGETLPLAQLSEMEEEAITEIGNIILNACISSLANVFHEHLNSDTPEYIHEELNDLFTEGERDDCFVLLLKMSFQLAEQSIIGHVTFIMDIESITKVRKQIDTMLGI